MIRLCILVLLLSLGAPARAGTAYQCTTADGKVIYQDKPCAAGQRQRTLQLDDSEPQAAPPAPAPKQAIVEPAAPPPAPATPAAPLPVMYACVRATDRTTYLSENGNPEPYQVPYGMVGGGGLSLSQAYGPPGGAGASAPELNRGRITPGLIARHFVWVQDQCHELTPAETCHALRDAYDENETRLRRSFKSDRPPLEKREATLLAQLRNC
ncbi:DUF4124 domain-containing protein [Dyella jiangningensis]|uniref:DUF4124 domain-containing protein n=1 Tax=Dyella jiangningensis TaxID=1379159 RepID=A0A328P3I5_9GAMM|nr:DUF4124 domain-containing protein [Dyella jiangningensis]RAO75841.1 DUF4124 domain-containing protein [Dyella jiangningensis]